MLPAENENFVFLSPDRVVDKNNQEQGRFYIENHILTIFWDIRGREEFIIKEGVIHKNNNNLSKGVDEIKEKIIHFVYFIMEGRESTLSMMEYIAIKSAMKINKGFVVYFHTNKQFHGDLWDDLKENVVVKYCSIPEYVYGNKIERVEHKSDVKRLEVIYFYGGIYLDLDTICVKPFRDILSHNVVLGREGGYGLCNAVIIAPPFHPFIKIWIEKYKNFNNDQWNYFSVLLPLQISNENPEFITIEPEDRFFNPTYHDWSIRNLFLENHEYPNAYIFHLWGKVSKKYINSLTVDMIFSKNTTYNIHARKFLLPEKLMSYNNKFKNKQGEFINISSEVFSNIVEENGISSVFGPASFHENTIEYRNFLEKFIIDNSVHNIVDIGCGDFRVFEKCSFHNASYLGLDISDKVVEYNKMMYSKEKINFQKMPASFTDLPTGDLLIIKGLFQHLSDDEIISFRDVVLEKYKFCLITNSFDTEGVTRNTNIDSGVLGL